MKTETTMSISNGRKEIFSIAEKVQERGAYYTLTERGRPKVVVLAARKFENLMRRAELIRDDTLDEDNTQGAAFISENLDQKYQVKSSHKSLNRGKRVYRLKEDEQVLIIRDKAQVSYSANRAIEKIKDDQDLLIAQLYVELIENYSYPLQTIKLASYVRVGEKFSRRYIEADVIICGERVRDGIIFAIEPFDKYEKHKKERVKELFDIAREFKGTDQEIGLLVYFSRSHKRGKMSEKKIIINYKKNKTFSNWNKNGSPNEKNIPKFKD